MKRIVAVLLAVLMVVSMVSCGKIGPDVPGFAEENSNQSLALEQPVADTIPASDMPEMDTPVSTDEEPTSLTETAVSDGITPETSVPDEAVPEEMVPYEVDMEPVSGNLGEYHVTILGAEDFVTMEGEPGIRFYYDFTNNSDSPAPAWAVLGMEARQDDYELVTAYAEFGMDVPEYPNDSLRIQPGMTIRCVEEYNFKPLGGMLEFTLSDLMGEQTLTMRTDPDHLQGRPEELKMSTITEPKWLLGVSSDLEGSAFYVQFHGYELITNLEGEPAIRVFYEYTNRGDVPNAFFYDLNLLAFQDGVELQYSWMEESAQEENNSTLEIQPGESLVVASVYDLRGESPVDIFVEAMWEDGYCGVTVPVLSYPDE